MEEEEEQVLDAAHQLGSAGETLPELTNELLSAQTSQFSEIERKEELLEHFRGQLAAVEKQLLAVREEVDAAVRSICLKEDLLARLGRQCGGLQGEVQSLVQEREQLQLGHKNAVKKEKMEEKVRENYRGKMQLHQARTRQLGQLSPKERELDNLKEKICLLKVKREKYFDSGVINQMVSGENQQCILDQIAALQASRQIQTQEIPTLQAKIAKNMECIESLKMEIETGKKRQAAQLRRMQRLVGEAQAHRRQWAKRAGQLRATITTLKDRIEE